MRTKSNILLLLGTLLGFFFASCNNESAFQEDLNRSLDGLSKSQKAIIEYAENFGQVHNDGLAFILGLAMVETKSNNLSFSEEQSRVFVFDALDKFMNQTTKGNISIANHYDELTNDDIRKLMSDRELGYIDDALANYNSPDYLNALVKLIVSDKDLSESQMYATTAFVATLKYSAEYWKYNLSSWNKAFGKPETKASWDNVITADAFYGWWGTVGTGGNVAIGAGCAVAASVFSAL